MKKYFPVKGIGTITIDVPENWYDNVQTTATDDETNEIEIVLLDLDDYSVTRISIGKVDDSWKVDDIKKQLTATLGVFFKKREIKLKGLASGKIGFKYSGISIQEGKKIIINTQSELRNNFFIKALTVGYIKSDELLRTSNKVIDSVNIFK